MVLNRRPRTPLGHIFGNSSPGSGRQVFWAPIYEAVFNILGTTGVVIPMGDTNDENTARTTVTTRGEVQAVFTYSEAIGAFDVPPMSQGPAGIPVITFNGTDEEADSPDDAYWSRVAGAFSVGAWVNFRDATNSVIWSKFDNAGNTREWIFGSDGADKITLFLFDESVGGNPSIETVTDATGTEGTWVLCVATYDGTANASGINIYDNGVLAASTDTDNANFINLEELGGTIKLAHLNSIPGSIFDGKMAGGPLGPFFTQVELTADQVLRLYQLGRVALGV